MSFKNGSGKWLTNALFFELTTPDTRDKALFTLKDENHTVDGVEYLSLKQAFVTCNDPTEYEFANRFLGGWSHWIELQESSQLKDEVEKWRAERDIRYKSIGQKKMFEMANSEDPSFQAVKWLSDGGWKDKEAKGRPKKADVQKAAKEQAGKLTAVTSDWQRIKNA